MGEIHLSNEQQATLRAAFTSRGGNEVKIEGKPEWSSSDESIVTCQPSDDGMSCELVTVDDAEGEAEVTVTGDADLGEGETTNVTATLMVKVSGAEARAANIKVSDVRDKEAPQGTNMPADADPLTGKTPGQDNPSGTTDNDPGAGVDHMNKSGGNQQTDGNMNPI